MFFRINKVIDSKLVYNFSNFVQRAYKLNREVVYIIFDSPGGFLSDSGKIIDIMNASKLKFVGIAYKRVNSAALPIFLSSDVRFGYGETSALIHRVEQIDLKTSKFEVQRAEKEVFEILSKKLEIPIENIYEMADKNTVIDLNHSLGKKLFLNK